MPYDIDWYTNPLYPHIQNSDDGIDLESAIIIVIRFHALLISDHIKEIERLTNAVSRNRH